MPKRSRKGVASSPERVVAPTSVLPNWEAEVKRFRPSLKVSVYHGPGRALDETADVTLTTYALLRLDAARADVARVTQAPAAALAVGATPLAAVTADLARDLALLRCRMPRLEVTLASGDSRAIAASVGGKSRK